MNNNVYKIMWSDLTTAAQDRILDKLNINLQLCFNRDQVMSSYEEPKQPPVSIPAIEKVKKVEKKANAIRYSTSDNRRMIEFIAENYCEYGGKMSLNKCRKELGISTSKFYGLLPKTEAYLNTKTRG